MEIDVFISHHTASSLHIVEGIANKLEADGVRCWYAPRNTEGAYASSIVKAINSCAIFLLILNRQASESIHVLNEIDMVSRRLTRSEDVKVIPFHVADDEIGEDAQYYLGRLHWIDAMTPPMYKRIDELVEHLEMLLGREGKPRGEKGESGQRSYRLLSRLPQAREVFEGRESLLEQMHGHFAQGKRCLFLEGIGGIGKSELAKQYALRFQREYDQVLFVSYQGSLQSLVCDADAFAIENLEPQTPEEDERAFFLRKLRVLQSIAGERTLIIVDNFDVDGDEDLDRFLEGRCHVILTTRNAHPGRPTLRVEAMEDMGVLLDIFRQNYGEEVDESETATLQEIFRRIACHTYTVELIAKQMSASFLTAGEMLALLEQGEMEGGLSETVAGRRSVNTAFGHICSVFNTSGLGEEDKQILRCLSLMGHGGVSAVRFREWMALSSFEPVNRLIRRSWIIRGAEKRIALHPLVIEVVHAMLRPTVENCGAFLDRMGAFLFTAWLRPYQENLAVAENVLAVAAYFPEPDTRALDAFEPISGFLWQVGRFDASIENAHRFYDACCRQLGENSPMAGYAAKNVGGCYFNSRRMRESMPWYRLGLEIMLRSGMEENEDLAMAYEKAGRSYTWEYDQDFDKAQACFEQALAIRQRNIAALERGEKRDMLMKNEHYGLPLARERVGETYMEMGRMYQLKGEYRKALECTQLHEQSVSERNPSGLAYSYFDEGVSLYHLGLEARAALREEEAGQWWSQAEEKLSKALEINLRMRGTLAADTVENQEALGDLYAAQGRLGEASNAYMAVLSMLEGLFGRDDPRLLAVKEKMDFGGGTP
ncbi:MAG TPA: TIR domain-containing protein [Candidatus Galloscillospira stercoripullorum]|nr:TIR domain-containing protein [Candidatus Galloscillospira stercoripullorum]